MSKNMLGTCSKHWVTLPPPLRSLAVPPLAVDSAAAGGPAPLAPSAEPMTPALRNRRIPRPYLIFCSCAFLKETLDTPQKQQQQQRGRRQRQQQQQQQ